jgi:hypothetical protein
MTHDNIDAVEDQLVCGGHGLLALAVVVDFDQPSGLPENTACRIQIRDGHLGAALDRFAHPGVRSGVRRRETDQDLGVGERGGADGPCEGNNASCHKLHQGLGPPGDQPR